MKSCLASIGLLNVYKCFDKLKVQLFEHDRDSFFNFNYYFQASFLCRFSVSWAWLYLSYLGHRENKNRGQSQLIKTEQILHV